jgi:uncharacterized protein YbbC (DUF1343 family)
MTVRTGLDRLAAGEGPRLCGAAVSLLCHPASVDRRLRAAPDVLAEVGARLCSLLGPEHGLDAAAQDMEAVHAPRERPHTPVHSLYGDDPASLRPRPEQFHGAEWLVCDLQDVGSRYYTYVWTVLLATQAALAAGLRVLVLDRPNPLGGLDGWVEGGVVAPGQESFVGLHPVATRHGMTVGELVTLALAEVGTPGRERVEVLECAGWRRDALFSGTGLPWVLPSPNMPTLETALVYPGQCLLEGTNLSEGRGTTRPFELFGAPWIDGDRLAAALSADEAPGLRLRPCAFKPTFHKFAGERCGGIQLHVDRPERVRSLSTAWALLREVWHASGGRMRWRTERYEFVDDRPAIDLLAGGPWLREAIEAGTSTADMLAAQEDERRGFLARRRPFLRYPDR